MKACFNQSTKHSEIKTVKAGEKVVKSKDGLGNNVVAIIVLLVVVVGIEVDNSNKLRNEIMNNINAN